MSAASRAPPELLYHIFDYLPRPGKREFRPRAELLPLLFVCRAWHAVAEAPLYHSIGLGDTRARKKRADAPACARPASALRAVLIESPRLASLVRELRLRTFMDRRKRIPDWVDIISSCPNLQRLSLGGFFGASAHALRVALSHISKLRAFTLAESWGGYFADSFQIFELMRRWPLLEEIDVGTAIATNPPQLVRRKGAPDNIDPDAIWIDRDRAMCELMDLRSDDWKHYEFYGEPWVPAYPAIVAGVWPHLRKVAVNLLNNDSMLAVLPVMAPNITHLELGPHVLGEAFNNALVRWGASLTHIHLSVERCFDNRVPCAEDIRLYRTLTSLSSLQTAELHCWLLPPSDFIYTPPSLRSLTYYVSNADNFGQLASLGIMDDHRAVPGLQALRVVAMQRGNDEEDIAFDAGDIKTITEACDKRNIEFRCKVAARGSHGGASVTDDNDDPDYLSNDTSEDDDADDYYTSDSSLSIDPDDADNGDILF